VVSFGEGEAAFTCCMSCEGEKRSCALLNYTAQQPRVWDAFVALEGEHSKALHLSHTSVSSPCSFGGISPARQGLGELAGATWAASLSLLWGWS